MKPRVYKFSPGWLTGLTQADGSFLIAVKAQVKGLVLYRLVPVFSLSQSLIDEDMMKALHKYLGVGKLNYNRDAIELVVSSMQDILIVVIPHFDAHPPRGAKLISYLIFRAVVIAMQNGTHKTPSGFLMLLNLCYFMNGASQRTPEQLAVIVAAVKAKFGDVTPDPTVMLDFHIGYNKPIDPDYLAGMFDGDGSVGFEFLLTPGSYVKPFFQVTLGLDDYYLLHELMVYFQCGNVSIASGGKQAASYRVSSVSDMVTYIKPFLSSVHLNTVKQTYLPHVFEVWSILQTGGIKSNEDLLYVVELVYNLNRDGVKRKLTKEVYLSRISLY